MPKPICENCGDNKNVVVASYPDGAKFYECEGCYTVVAPILDTVLPKY